MNNAFETHGTVDHRRQSKAALLDLLIKLNLKSAASTYHLETFSEMMNRMMANYGIPDTLIMDANTFKAYRRNFISAQDPDKEES